MTTLRTWAGVTVVAVAGALLAACGSSGGTAGGHSGTADVAYAASLENLNEKTVGPAFTKAEQYKYSGTAGESGALEAEIASGEISPGVFEAIGGDNITPLFPKFAQWYIQYAATQIVVAYNPASKDASQFEAIANGSKPVSDLFTLMEQPGFLLGRTDPNTDPQGRSFIYMLELAQAQYHLPADTVTKILGGPLASPSSKEIFAEAALEPRLQAGQLDASSAYLSQAIQLHLHYIVLPSAINLGDAALATQYHNASITITGNVLKHGSPLVADITLIGKPTAAATAYVQYVLSKAGRALYTKGGYALLPPTAFGDTSAIPASIHRELGG